jgi:hypothetical protein
MKAMVFIEQTLGGFQGILRGDDKPDLIESRIIRDVAGNDQVTYMYGVKGTEVQTNIHLMN